MTLGVEYLSSGRWRLTKDLEHYDPKFGKIIVKAGTETDMDSVPRLPFAYWMVKNCSVIGAVVHDAIYAVGKINGIPVTREDADRIFLDAMVIEGVSWWQRRMIWFGVRVGGWLPWRRHREKGSQEA